MLRVSFHEKSYLQLQTPGGWGRPLLQMYVGRDRRELLVASGAGLEVQGIVTFVVMSLLARWGQ